MSLEIKPSSKFKRDLKRVQSRGYKLELLKQVIDRLAAEKTLAPEQSDHPLSGKWSGYRECHIQPDWLLIYRIEKNDLFLLLMRTGTHSDLFGE